MNTTVTPCEIGKGRKRTVNRDKWKRVKMQVLRYVKNAGNI